MTDLYDFDGHTVLDFPFAIYILSHILVIQWVSTNLLGTWDGGIVIYL